MTLQEIFDQLVQGELSQWSIGGAPQGEITEASYPKLVAHVNLALTNLYRRFNLKEGSLRLMLEPGKYAYSLHSDHSTTNHKSKKEKYILDGGIPFQDDILKLEKVFTEMRAELAINVDGDPLSCSTPTATTLVVPRVIADRAVSLEQQYKTEVLDVVYRANHPKIVLGLGYFDPERIQVELPYTHLEALCYFVAGRVAAPAGMTTEERLNNVWYMKYEQECQQLEAKGFQIDIGGENHRLHRNGFV